MTEAVTLPEKLQIALQHIQAGRLAEADPLLKSVVAAGAKPAMIDCAAPRQM